MAGKQYAFVLLCLMCLTLTTFQVQCARILGVFPVASVSHQVVFQPIWRELSLRGHDVTVLTPNPLRDLSLINLTEIDLGFLYNKLENVHQTLSAGPRNHWTALGLIMNMSTQLSEWKFESDEVMRLVQDDTVTFDVALVEAVDPATYAFAAKFKCPVIGVASMSILNPTHEAMGNPGHPVLYPDLSSPYYGRGGELSFFEKVDALLYDLYLRYMYHFYFLPNVNGFVRKYFGDKSIDIRDVEKNMSLLFLNTNPVFHGPRAYGPNIIELGGAMHLQPKKPLPTV